MEEVKVFDITELHEMKLPGGTNYYGYVYALEWDNKIKIGCTKNIVNRMKQHMIVAKYGNIKLGKVGISPIHVNYCENEKALHNMFKNMRVKNTELFKTGLSDVLSAMDRLSFSHDLPNEIEKNKFYNSLKKIIFDENVEKIENDKKICEFLKRLLSLQKESVMQYKYYTKYCDYHFPLDSNSIFTNCEICGREIELSLSDVLDEEGNLLEEATWYCDKCSKFIRFLGESKEC